MILQKDTYENVKSMLESPDEENVMVGLSCIENCDQSANLIYILCLIKETNISSSLWVKHAPETTELFKNLFKGSITFSSITWNNIIVYTQVYDTTIEDYQFLMDRFALYLKDMFNQGKDVIESVTITIKEKPKI